jgi:hypothetical protein
MLTQDAIKHKAGFDLSNSLFVLSFLAMCLCEAYVIRGVWIAHTPFHGRARGSELPFLIWVPAVAVLMLRLAIGKRMEKAEIRPSLAANLNAWVGGVLLLAYLLMARMAEIIFS